MPSLLNGGGASASGAGFNLSGALGGAMIGLAIGNAIGGMYSAFKTAKTTSYTQKMQAQIAQNNQQIMNMGKELAYRQGEIEIGKLTQKSAHTKAKQRVGAASSGVAVGVGNSAEIMASTDVHKAQDRWTLEMNALQAAWGYSRKANEYGAQSSAMLSASKYNSDSAWAHGVSSLMDDATKIGKQWYLYNGNSWGV